MLLGLFVCLYMIVAIVATVVIADMNHRKSPGFTDWLFGLGWLPILLLLAFVHWRYKAS